MSTDDNSSILQQKSSVFASDNKVELTDSCTVGNGIVRLTEQEMKYYARVFDDRTEQTTFFVPASGSGSRMFSELAQFVETKEETESIRKFFKFLPEMAIFREFPLIVREKFAALQSVYVAEYLISEEGMNFPARPKGLIPFHVFGDVIYNPFQEQFLQAMEVLGAEGKIHFTIQEGVENNVRDSLALLQKAELSKNVSFSCQDSLTDAYCFEEDGAVVQKNGIPVRRPSGHGALLVNLNNLEEDLVLVKNIDNVQHWSKSDLNRKVWKYCTGMLLEFKHRMKLLSDDYSFEKLEELNNTFQFLSQEELLSCDAMKIQEYSRRPSRVCGMVINEGAPGGGPFWIKDQGVVSKQIVEKVQISEDDKSIMEQSSHFNPVFIALSKSDCNGNQLDLTEFVDYSKYLVVNKPYESRVIKYRELPGLWNGSMSNWNTIFVEIPKDVFSPVKSLLDLMDDAHKI